MPQISSVREKISLRDLFFYLYFMLLFGMRMWGVYEGKPTYAPLLALGFMLWGISFVLTEHTVFECIWAGLLLILAGVVYINSGEKGLLMYFTLIIGMKGVDQKRLFKWGAVSGGLGMIVLGFLTTFGIIEDVVYAQTRHFVGNVLRHALGAPHPNTLGTSFTIIAMMILYCIGHGDRKRVWKATAILTAIAVYIYIFAQSRTGIMITVAVLALNLIYTYRQKLGVIEKVVLILLLPALWVVSICIPAFASEKFLEMIKAADYTFFVRFNLGKYYLENNDIVSLGQRLSNPGGTAYGIDISFLNLLLQAGVIAFIIINLIWILLITDEVRENRTEELVIVFSLLVMGVTDPLLYNISFKNIAFVFAGTVIYKYSDMLSGRLPEALNKTFCLVPIGRKEITLPAAFGGAENMSGTKNADEDKAPSGDGSMSVHAGNRKRIALFIIPALMLLVSIAVYVATPDPSYVLLDRNTKEHVLIKDIVGHTYTADDVARIRKEGNYVINYSGEDELMYTYYSDDKNPIADGFYAPNLPKVEKMRRSLGIFVWGSVVLSAIYVIVLKRITGHEEKQK